MNFSIWHFFIFVIIFPTGVYPWDSLQLEVFDIVEEVQQNFYDLLGISHEADLAQIKSAYRKLSLILHPDKNPEEDAAVKFRQLVAVYDVLRNPEKRRYYNEVLVNGLPNWKSAIYYYRKAKRITLIELSLFLFFIISLGQYLMGWASYFERKFTLEANRRSKQKKLPIEDISKPSVINTLPVQLPVLLWNIIHSLPSVALFIKSKITEQLEARTKIIDIEESEEDENEVIRPQKRKHVQELPDYSGIEMPSYNSKVHQLTNNNDLKKLNSGPWSDEEMGELAKLVKKFPGGMPGRWDHIAEALNRSIDDVTKVTKSLRQNSYKAKMISVADKELMEKIKPQTKTENIWTQQQQQALENALQTFSKSVSDRWDKIAECVPDKSKEECILRYKYLVETVKKQRKKEVAKEENVQ
ncbi:dnaJ homolog subfamily C member 1 [Agrilus planipennis]|uniref:DnaJ homolog subfamily C member 1 n=1 Tax=Agrilus planipennis TaxID=224129 RepID=A0A1W4X7X3_AGRPL|nr:dnaJ homolog subfamily C member 1 [Agrilus planipennis]